MNYKLIVGVDESDQEYVLTLLNASDGKYKQMKVTYSGKAIQDAVDLLRKSVGGDLRDLAVVFEKPAGAFQDYLHELAVDVYTINAKQVKALRERYVMSGKKDDWFDSFVLADSFRTDYRLTQFKLSKQPSADAMKLMALTRACWQYDTNLRRVSNQLRLHVHRVFPQLLSLCNATDKRWLWSLLDMAPTPSLQAKLSPEELTALLKRHQISAFTAQDLHRLLQQPAIPVADGVVEIAATVINSMVPTLMILKRERDRLHKERKAFLEQVKQRSNGGRPSDAAIVDSMPGFGTMVTAALMGYCETAISARDEQHLRKRTGVAAVFVGSGKTGYVQQRYACSRTLRHAMFWAANAAVQKDEHWKEYYLALRARGKSRGRSLRGVADRLLNVLVAMLRNGEFYDKDRWPKKAAQVSEAPDEGPSSPESKREALPPWKHRAAAKDEVKVRGAKRSAQRGSASEH